jgi:hypothetical protein
VDWPKSWRIIPSRFPPISVFERISKPEDLELVAELESITNDRLRSEVGDLTLVPPSEWVYGPGAGYIMAAFTHLNPSGSRFCNGNWGVYYAANSLDGAIAETKYHRELFMKATQEPPASLDMRVLIASISGELEDLRGDDLKQSGIYSSDSY